jgi:hypothetical protein
MLYAAKLMAYIWIYPDLHGISDHFLYIVGIFTGLGVIRRNKHTSYNCERTWFIGVVSL